MNFKESKTVTVVAITAIIKKIATIARKLSFGAFLVFPVDLYELDVFALLEEGTGV
ncbi:MAG: hypothetical protein ACI4M5_02040 [Christensenellales bacterium]